MSTHNIRTTGLISCLSILMLATLGWSEGDSAYRAMSREEMRELLLHYDSDSSRISGYSKAMIGATKEERRHMVDNIIELLKDDSEGVYIPALFLIPHPVPPEEEFDRICQALIDIYDTDPISNTAELAIVNLQHAGATRLFVAQKLYEIITSTGSDLIKSRHPDEDYSEWVRHIKRNALTSLTKVVPDAVDVLLALWDTPHGSYMRRDMMSSLARYLADERALRFLIDIMEGEQAEEYRRKAYGLVRGRELMLKEQQAEAGLTSEEASHLRIIQKAIAKSTISIPDDKIPYVRYKKLQEKWGKQESEGRSPRREGMK